MKREDCQDRTVDVSGSQVRLTSYRVEHVWHCKADIASPAACLTRATGETRQKAEEVALERAAALLGGQL